MSLPTAPDLLVLPSGSLYVALGVEGLDLVVDFQDGAIEASILWFGLKVRRVLVGLA